MLADYINDFSRFVIDTKNCLRVYLVPPSVSIPFLEELCVERARAFNPLSEYSPNHTDLDQYDFHYYQMIVWDSFKNKLVGGQRFRFNLYPFLSDSYKNSYLEYYHPGTHKRFFAAGKSFAEVGRTFVMPDYQKKKFLKVLIRGLYRIPEYLNINYVLGLISYNHLYYEEYINNVFLNSLKASKFNGSLDLFSYNHNDVNIPFLNKGLWNGTNLSHLESLISKLDYNFVLPVVLKPYRYYCNVSYEGYSVAHQYNRIMQLLFSGRVDSISNKQSILLNSFNNIDYLKL